MSSIKFKNKMLKSSINHSWMMIVYSIQGSRIVFIKWISQCLGSSMRSKQNKYNQRRVRGILLGLEIELRKFVWKN